MYLKTTSQSKTKYCSLFGRNTKSPLSFDHVGLVTSCWEADVLDELGKEL